MYFPKLRLTCRSCSTARLFSALITPTYYVVTISGNVSKLYYACESLHVGCNVYNILWRLIRLVLPCSAWRKWRTNPSSSVDFGTELQNVGEFIYDAKFHHSHFFSFIFWILCFLLGLIFFNWNKTIFIGLSLYQWHYNTTMYWSNDWQHSINIEKLILKHITNFFSLLCEPKSKTSFGL